MNVKVSYTGYLELAGIKNGSEIEVQDGTTLSDLLTQCQVRKEHQRTIRLFVNNEEKKLPSLLQDGDEVMFVMQVGGG